MKALNSALLISSEYAYDGIVTYSSLSGATAAALPAAEIGMRITIVNTDASNQVTVTALPGDTLTTAAVAMGTNHVQVWAVYKANTWILVSTNQ